jgi:hypothetical protein
MHKLLIFIVINSQTDLDLFSRNHIKISVPYSSVKWNKFASYIEPYGVESLSNIRWITWRGGYSVNQLYRLTRILGPKHLAVQQLYLSIIHTHTYVADTLFEEPRRATQQRLTEQGWPEYFKMDLEFTQNRMISINEAWLAKLKFYRSELWGAAEADVNLPMLLQNVWHGELWSIFAPVVFE